MGQEYISVCALSRELDVSEQMIYRYVKKKILPSVKVERSTPSLHIFIVSSHFLLIALCEISKTL